MSLYRAVGRPLFFALSPESAHRIARRMLGLPLPWERIGGARDDPRLQLNVAGINLRNPVGLAAGFDKACGYLDALGRLGFGYVVGGTVTRRPRRGHPKPRIVRYAGRESLVNAMGLPNPGARRVAAGLESQERTAPRFVSLGDQALEDVVANHELLEPLVDGIELNVSCPNVSWGRDRDNEEHLGKLLASIGAGKSKPLFVKLPPFRSDVEREVVLALARIAQEGGADGLTCSNSRPVGDLRLAVAQGGLSGRALFESTVRIVREVWKATGGELPINACGGIFTAGDALACIEAGATTVQVYTGLIYEGPKIIANITSGLAEAVAERGVHLSSLIGVA